MLGKRVTVSADYDYYVPTFDGDSIWNFFAGEPMNDVGLRANVGRHRPAVRGRRRARARLQRADRAVQPRQRRSVLALAELLAARDLLPEQRPSLRRRRQRLGSLEDGGDDRDPARQRQLGRRGRPRGGRRRTRSTCSRRATWRARGRASGNGTTSSSRIGARRASTTSWALGYRFAPRAQAMVEWEHDINRSSGSASASCSG